jgi:hypothetical protein
VPLLSGNFGRGGSGIFAEQCGEGNPAEAKSMLAKKITAIQSHGSIWRAGGLRRVD